MLTTSLYLASPCYGGLAQARYLRALLAFKTACAEAGLPLQLELGGGEALLSRGRAGMMARFLAGEATHLLFVDACAAFAAEEVFALLGSGAEVAACGDGDQPRLLLISREAARRMKAAYPDLAAGLGDVRNAGAGRGLMLFEAVIDPATRAYVADLAALRRRWEQIGGAVWTPPAPE